MLVLSRTRGEQIVIGEGAAQVVVTLVEIRGDKVRLGISAPAAVPVHRREVYELIERQRRKISPRTEGEQDAQINPAGAVQATAGDAA